jgi:hypothetical protein
VRRWDAITLARRVDRMVLKRNLAALRALTARRVKLKLILVMLAERARMRWLHRTFAALRAHAELTIATESVRLPVEWLCRGQCALAHGPLCMASRSATSRRDSL